MIESIDGDFPQLIESQMINNQAPTLPHHYPNSQFA